MRLSRRAFVASSLAAAPPQRRPNILFLMPDQHRYHTLGCNGDPQAKTPHLDRLATQSTVLDRTFANTPVCCPARAVLLTGQYCHKNGMVANDLHLREDHHTFAHILKENGYRTGFIGKWHLDGGLREPGYVPPGPRRQGFEFWAAHQCSHRHFDNHFFRDTPTPIRLGKFEAEGWADVAVEFLDQTKTDSRPFYLTVQWGPPHDPYKAPEAYSRQFDPAKLKMRPNYQPNAKVPTPALIAEYYAMVTAIDDQIGRLMAKLEELGLAENTIVLYSSDHGDMLGSQGQRLKRKPWEESIHVPGILRWPGHIKAGVRSDVFFTHVDFAPTLLGMAGITPSKAMQGHDLSGPIAGKGKGPDSAFFQIFGPSAGDGTEGAWRGVRTATHMYARYQDRPWILYDLTKDPFQQHNLVGQPEAKALHAKLEKRLVKWMADTGDSWSYNWSVEVEEGGRLYKHRTFNTVQEYLDWAAANPTVK